MMDIALKGLLIACHFVCPLLFFTDLTRNPYVTQIALLNAALLMAAAVYLAKQQGSQWRLPRTPLDLPLAAWVFVCVFSWSWAYFHHSAFYRDAMAAEGLRVMAFTLTNTLLPFFLAVVCSRNVPAQSRLPSLAYWAAFALVWGALWTLFPQMRSSAGGTLDLWTHLWDPYGGILWLAGLAALGFLMRGGATFHHYWHAALCVGFLSSVYGVCQYFNLELIWPKVLNPYGGRSVSTFGNPNFMSSYMVLLLPLSLAYYLKARTLGGRVVYAAVFLALEACLLSSLTRSSWAGAAAALAVLAFSTDLRRCARENLETHGLAASLAVLMILLWPQSSVSGYTPSVFGRIQELGGIADVKSSAPYSPFYQRVLIWSCAWLMGAENPLWGKGWGLFELFYPFYQGHVLSLFELFRTMRTHANNTHNELMEIWAQTGILGVGVQAWLWSTFFVAALRRVKAMAARSEDSDAPWVFAAMAGIAGMLVDNILNVSLHFAVPAFLFWWQAGVVMARTDPEGCDARAWHLGHRALAACAAAVVAVFCLTGCWWWARQWNREVRYFQGFKLVRAGQMAKAIETLEAAHRWHGREVNANYELGNAYARSQQYPQAVQAYGEALKSNAGYDEIYFNRATVLFQHLSRPEDALRDYRVAQWINPLSMDIYTGLSAFYLKEPGRYRDDCIELLEQAVRFYPANPNFLNNLGYLYRMRREDDKAQEMLARALRLSPDMQLAHNNLKELARASGKPPHPILAQLDAARDLEARIARKDYSPATLELARKVARWFPDGGKARFFLGNLEMLNGHPQAALEALEPLVALDPKNAALQRNLGEVYLRLGRNQESLRAFQAAIQSDPSDPYVRQRLSQLSHPPNP